MFIKKKNFFSERSLDGSLCGSSLTSLNEDQEANHTSSSDSKLYKNKESSKMLTSTYPCLKNTLHPNFLTNCLEKSSDSNKSMSHKNSNNNCSSTMCSSFSSDSYENNSNYETKLTGCERLAVNSSHDKLDAGSTGKNLNVSRKNSDCKYFDPQDCFNCSNVIFQQTNDSKSGECFSYHKKILTKFIGYLLLLNFLGSASSVSSLNGSLGSLRRRWMQSHAASVDGPCCDETETAPSKTRTKLGLGLVIDLTDTLQE